MDDSCRRWRKSPEGGSTVGNQSKILISRSSFVRSSCADEDLSPIGPNPIIRLIPMCWKFKSSYKNQDSGGVDIAESGRRSGRAEYGESVSNTAQRSVNTRYTPDCVRKLYSWSLGHTMEDETLVRKLLNAVPDRYLQIVALIEQYSDLSEMTLEEAIGRLKTYEERIKYKRGKQVDNQEKLMFTRHENKGKYFRGRGRGKHRFSQGRNHENFKEERKDGETSHKSYNRNNFKKSSYDTSKLLCFKCKEYGHFANKCPSKKEELQ
ncbi:zinc finger, CCHC-type containing protein [Tanacetum coccineum]